MNSKSEPILDAFVKNKIEESKKENRPLHLALSQGIFNILARSSLAIGIVAFGWVLALAEMNGINKVYFCTAILIATPTFYILLRALGEACEILLNLNKRANQSR